MTLLGLAWKSIWNRRSTTWLTVLSIALSTALLLSVEKIRIGAEQGFSNAISQTDLIVGARTGSINLLLYTVFNIGSVTANVSYGSFEKYSRHPAVDWTIPYSLGDGHRGFRVVGTTNDFFDHYRFHGGRNITLRQGTVLQGSRDVVLGGRVAEVLGYRLSEPIVVTHGVTQSEGFQHHDDHPFKVVGIMEKTGTALDESLYISLEGMEAMHGRDSSDQKVADDHRHESERQGDDHDKDHRHDHSPESKVGGEHFKIKQITAFFLKTKNRIEALQLLREINTDTSEALTAIIPAATLGEVWRGLSYVEGSLLFVSWMVLLVSMVSMLISILTSLNERRREIAILRALGAGLKHILFLLCFESLLLIGLGVLLGGVLHSIGFVAFQQILMNKYGIYISASLMSVLDLYTLVIALGLGLMMGFIPAIRAVRMSLKDGLTQSV